MMGRSRAALGVALGAALCLAGPAWPGPAEAAGARDGRARAHQHDRHHARAKPKTASKAAPKVKAARRAPAHVTRAQKGEASVYSTRLSGRPMADGTPFDPRSDAAASKTLPLGTTARVTNLDNGRTTTVKIQDRGPYVRGRILDVSPKHARRLGIGKEGTAPVAVVPISVPADATAPGRQVPRK